MTDYQFVGHAVCDANQGDATLSYDNCWYVITPILEGTSSVYFNIHSRVQIRYFLFIAFSFNIVVLYQ